MKRCFAHYNLSSLKMIRICFLIIFSVELVFLYHWPIRAVLCEFFVHYVQGESYPQKSYVKNIVSDVQGVSCALWCDITSVLGVSCGL